MAAMVGLHLGTESDGWRMGWAKRWEPAQVAKLVHLFENGFSRLGGDERLDVWNPERIRDGHEILQDAGHIAQTFIAAEPQAWNASHRRQVFLRENVFAIVLTKQLKIEGERFRAIQVEF